MKLEKGRSGCSTTLQEWTRSTNAGAKAPVALHQPKYHSEENVTAETVNTKKTEIKNLS